MTSLIDFNDATPQKDNFNNGRQYNAMLQAAELKEKLISRISEVLHYLLPAGQIKTNSFYVGDVQGNEGNSLVVEINGAKAGVWYDFATDERGDIISLWAAVTGKNIKTQFLEIAQDIADWLGKNTIYSSRHNATQLKQKENSKDTLGTLTASWDYLDAEGQVIARVYRYDSESGKQYRPWDAKTNRYAAPEVRPLYNLAGIKNSSTIVLAEGEKAAQALIDAGICATTAMFGANAPMDKTDWLPLKGKNIIIWPDKDKAGEQYAEKLVDKLSSYGLASLEILPIPAGKPKGWDAADAVVDIGAAHLYEFICYSLKMTEFPTDTVVVDESFDVATQESTNAEEQPAIITDAPCEAVNPAVVPNALDAAAKLDSTPVNSVISLKSKSQKLPPKDIITTTTPMSAHRSGYYIYDEAPELPDIIAPGILLPGSLLVLGGAPKVGKSDLLLSWLAHMSMGIPFLGMIPPRPLKIFYLQAEIGYFSMRKRLKKMVIDPKLAPLMHHNLVITPQVDILLDEDGVQKVIETMSLFFDPSEIDLFVVDPLRNVYDNSEGSENDNSAMMSFLRKRVMYVRKRINPNLATIIVHHTKKITKNLLEEDPFQAFSGAGSLRGFYNTGMIFFRPNEANSARQLMFELRDGEPIENKWVDKIDGRWCEVEHESARLINKDYGCKLDAERRRKHDKILEIIFNEGRKGKLYTSNLFCQVWEHKADLGGRHAIRDRIEVLTSKGYIKFVKTSAARSRNGYLCVEDMEVPTSKTEIDSTTGKEIVIFEKLLPTHYRSGLDGILTLIEDPKIWVYHDDISE